jgi:hypothetical protein
VYTTDESCSSDSDAQHLKNVTLESWVLSTLKCALQVLKHRIDALGNRPRSLTGDRGTIGLPSPICQAERRISFTSAVEWSTGLLQRPCVVGQPRICSDGTGDSSADSEPSLMHCLPAGYELRRELALSSHVISSAESAHSVPGQSASNSERPLHPTRAKTFSSWCSR